MKKISITEEQSQVVSAILSHITYEALKHERVEAVYFISYEEKGIYCIKINILLNYSCNAKGEVPKNEKLLFDKESSMASKILGIDFEVNLGDICDYGIMYMHTRERLAAADSVVANILFDRNGRLKKTANYFKNSTFPIPYINVFKYQPPLVMLNEEDTKIVLTKTKSN